MSYQAVDWVAEELDGISSTDAMVLVALVRKIPFGEDTVRAYQSDISKWSKANERTVRNACKRLIQAGILETKGRGGVRRDGHGIASEYRVIGLPMPNSEAGKNSRVAATTRNEMPTCDGENVLTFQTRRHEMPTTTGTKCRQEGGTKCRQLPNNQYPLTNKKGEDSGFHPAIEAWNEMADRVGIPKIAKITKARERAFSSRVKDLGGERGWQDFVGKIENSDFLTGKSSRGAPFRFTFDWATKEANFVKIMEGNYDGHSSTVGNEGSSHGNMAGNPNPGGSGQTTSIASLLARNRLSERSR